MLHYLSLSKKLGGFAAIAAFLLLFSGCGGSHITKPPELVGCLEFEHVGQSERMSVIKELYKHGESTPPEVAMAVQAVKTTCPGHPSEHVINAPAVAASNASAASPTTTTTAAATPTYPVVHFATDTNGGHQEVPEPGQTVPVTPDPTKGEWPFTIQLIGLKTSLNGFPPALQTPRGYEMMMAEANITSQVTGRTVPTPMGLDIVILCSYKGQALTPVYDPKGYDMENAEPDPDASLELGNGRPITWDEEWEVKEGLNLSEVTCEFEWEGQKSPLN